jgi:hypothetical protein
MLPSQTEEEPIAEKTVRVKHVHGHAAIFPAVYGCTDAEPEQHFLGWRNEVDPDALFASGKVWGLNVRSLKRR